ncbi:MAG: hypothetical protein LBI04_04575 [Treponema sp.]|nr:hypothetical protein [Treponema sp.]
MLFSSYKNNLNLLLFIFLFFLSTAVFSQEDPQEEQQDEPQGDSVSIINPDIIPDSVFIINSFDFNITGFTRPNALIRKGELKKGEEIKGLPELEEYIQEKTQQLYNERVLDSVRIDYTIGQPDDDGKFPVDVVITTKDTWNIVAIPRPRYSSNTGFDITLKARDYNFLGTMSPLRVDFGYAYNENKNTSFLFMFDSNIPFTAYGLNWNIKFLNDFVYRPDTEQPYYYKNTTGLSVELPLSFTFITVGLNESFILNEENADIYKPEYGNFQDGFYMSTNPFISWKIPIGIDVGSFGEIVFTPRVSAAFNHEFSEWPLDEIRKGTVLYFSQNLGFDHIDWIGNLRKGLDVSVYNSFDYNFYKAKNDKNPWTERLSFCGIGHFIITDFFGVSTQLMYRQWVFYDYGYTSAGDALRGIIDKDIFADYMLSLNLDLPLRIIRFLPSVWLNKPKLRIINFELYLAPFVDVAIYRDPVTKTGFDIKNTVASGGMEIVVFPEFFRSLFLRASIGWNISDFTGLGSNEVYIGTDFQY